MMFCAPLLLAIASTAVCQATDAPVLTLGRASLPTIEVDRGSKRVRSVALNSTGKVSAHVTRVTLQGDPVTLALIRRDARIGVKLGESFQYEIPAGDQARLEIAIESDGNGGKALELPITWNVVEPTTAADEDRPIAKPRVDLSKLVKEGPPPILKCDRYFHDFGRVHSGERLRTEFKLRNAGEGDLVIVKVGAQCHCTLPQLELPSGPIDGKKIAKDEVYGTLKPGEEATLHCEVDTAGLGGQMTKTIEIYSNDPTSTPQSIKLKLIVDNPFKFSPSSVSFGDVRRGQTIERTVRMASLEVGKFAITGYSLEEPQVMDVEYREVAARNDEQCAWELVLRTRDGLPCKEYVSKLRLELDHEAIHSVDQLHYSLRVLPDVLWTFKTQGSPNPLGLGIVRPGTNDVQSVIFENANPKIPYVLKEARIDSKLGTEPYATEIVELEKGQRYEVKIKLVKAPKTPAFKGELVILADHPTMPELKIGFFGMYVGSAAPAKEGAAKPADHSPRDRP